jgi:phosphatidate cytidylyltransferase
MEFQWNIVHSIFAGLTTFLALVSATLFVVSKAKPKANMRELIDRVNTWWWIIGILILALAFHRNVSMLFFAALSYFALREFLRMVHSRAGDDRIVLWCHIMALAQYYFIWTNWYTLFIIFIPVYGFLILPARAVIIGNTQRFLEAVGSYQWALMITAYTIGHLAFMLNLDAGYSTKAGPAGLVLFLLILTELNDVAQFTWGKLFGKHKIIPKVSPKKTWEGFIGGMITTTVLSYFLAPLLTPIGPAPSLFVGAAISGFGFIGDVTISAVKRDVGVKDSGTILKGHGGIMDRIDSLTYTAPLFFHFVRYFYT